MLNRRKSSKNFSLKKLKSKKSAKKKIRTQGKMVILVICLSSLKVPKRTLSMPKTTLISHLRPKSAKTWLKRYSYRLIRRDTQAQLSSNLIQT